MHEVSSNLIDSFLDGVPFAVAGASVDRSKYGNKVLRAYLQGGLEVYPVNPNADEVEGVDAFSNVGLLQSWLDDSALPKIHGLSIVTSPKVSERIVKEALAAGISHFWFQPGAESEQAVDMCRVEGVEPIFGGPRFS
jgi:uncharacterized protein